MVDVIFTRINSSVLNKLSVVPYSAVCTCVATLQGLTWPLWCSPPTGPSTAPHQTSKVSHRGSGWPYWCLQKDTLRNVRLILFVHCRSNFPPRCFPCERHIRPAARPVHVCQRASEDDGVGSMCWSVLISWSNHTLGKNTFFYKHRILVAHC